MIYGLQDSVHFELKTDPAPCIPRRPNTTGSGSATLTCNKARETNCEISFFISKMVLLETFKRFFSLFETFLYNTVSKKYERKFFFW